jgi:hypothetical protein
MNRTGLKCRRSKQGLNHANQTCLSPECFCFRGRWAPASRLDMDEHDGSECSHGNSMHEIASRMRPTRQEGRYGRVVVCGQYGVPVRRPYHRSVGSAGSWACVALALIYGHPPRHIRSVLPAASLSSLSSSHSCCSHSQVTLTRPGAQANNSCIAAGVCLHPC